MLSLWLLGMFQCDCDKICSLYCSTLVFFFPFWKTMHVCIAVSVKAVGKDVMISLFLFPVPVLRLPHWTSTKSPTACWILDESWSLQLWLQVVLWALQPVGAAFLHLQCPSAAQRKPPSTTTTTSTISTTTTTRRSSREWWNPKACQFSWAKVVLKSVAMPPQEEALSRASRTEESPFIDFRSMGSHLEETKNRILLSRMFAM